MAKVCGGLRRAGMGLMSAKSSWNHQSERVWRITVGSCLVLKRATTMIRCLLICVYCPGLVVTTTVRAQASWEVNVASLSLIRTALLLLLCNKHCAEVMWNKLLSYRRQCKQKQHHPTSACIKSQVFHIATTQMNVIPVTSFSLQ